MPDTQRQRTSDLQSFAAGRWIALTACAMTLPRQIVPGTFYMVTRRCTQRQLLLRPDDETNNAYTYCMAEAASRFGIELLLPSAMSNHHHEVLYDRHGMIAQFVEHQHKMMANCLNVLRGRGENFWSSEQVSYVRLVDFEDVISKLVYAAVNPVKASLVERVRDWPGVNGLSALLEGGTLRARRPTFYFSDSGPMPEEVSLELVIPPELGDADEVRRIVRERVVAEERRLAAERAATGRRVLGRKAVLAQSWRAYPASPAERGTLRPTIAARNQWSRIEALRRNRDFLDAYRDAWHRWRAGLASIFPFGTYWLRRFANVAVATPGAA